MNKRDDFMSIILNSVCWSVEEVWEQIDSSITDSALIQHKLLRQRAIIIGQFVSDKQIKTIYRYHQILPTDRNKPNLMGLTSIESLIVNSKAYSLSIWSKQRKPGITSTGLHGFFTQGFVTQSQTTGRVHAHMIETKE